MSTNFAEVPAWRASAIFKLGFVRCPAVILSDESAENVVFPVKFIPCP